MSSSNIGLHSSQMYFIRSKRAHEKALRSYDDWVAKRARARAQLVDQIEAIRQSDSASKKSAQLLDRLEYQLEVMDSEDAEVVNHDFLKAFPNAHKCHRPAYVKASLENAIKVTEAHRQETEKMYRATLDLREKAGDLPSYVRRTLEAECAEPSPPSPSTSSKSGSSVKEPKPSLKERLQKLQAYLVQLESGKGVAKTFNPGRHDATPSKWAFSASTYYPRNPSFPTPPSPAP